MSYSFRPLRLSDAPAFRQSLDDPITARFTGTIPEHPSLAWARERIRTGSMGEAANDPREFGLFAEDYSGNETLLGGAGWFINGDDMLEVGYSIHPDHRGKGHAGRALAALIEHLRHVKGHAGDIWAGVDQTNAPSIRVLERAGFTRHGPWVFTHPLRGDVYDQWIYKLAEPGAD